MRANLGGWASVMGVPYAATLLLGGARLGTDLACGMALASCKNHAIISECPVYVRCMSVDVRELTH